MTITDDDDDFVFCFFWLVEMCVVGCDVVAVVVSSSKRSMSSVGFD
jgi:hypothetical protein